jgi:hypothetical protein
MMEWNGLHTKEVGRVRLVAGSAEVVLPYAVVRSCDLSKAEVFVTPRYDPEEGSVPVVAVSDIKDGKFTIREMNHAYCDVSWQVVAPYLP